MESVVQMLFRDVGVYGFQILLDRLFCGVLWVGVKIRGVTAVLEDRLFLVSGVPGEVLEMVKWVVGVLCLLSALGSM